MPQVEHNIPVESQEAILKIVEEKIPSDKREAFARYLEQRQSKFKSPPVDIKTFITSPEYLGKQDEIYPAVMEALIELNNGQYQEAVLTGAIGTAKTTIAVLTQAFQIYLLSCLRYPHKQFGLDPSSEIVIVFQSINERLAKSVDYARLKALIDASPYFKNHFDYDHRIESELKFPNRIIVKPVTGDVAGAIGQNVIGGVIDEINHMARTTKSLKAVDGLQYDQATALYNSISRRRKSRFMKCGILPGVLCLVGSKRFPGQFSDERMEAAKKDATIFVYDKRTWDVLPADRFSGIWFTVFIGDDARQPRILNPDEKLDTANSEQLMKVPVEYLEDFKRDIHEALREVGGISTMAVHPFFTNREKVAACFGRRRSIFNKTNVDYSTDELWCYLKRFEDLDQPRLVHIDLALTGDSAGLCIGYVKGFVDVKRGNQTVGKMPLINIDATLRIRPPRNGEIDFERIRRTLFTLRERGLNIEFATLDSFQSRDTIQILNSKGIKSSLSSVDKTLQPYDVLKTALLEGRVRIPADNFLLSELLGLELDIQKGKVDHSPRGSKDVADALAGVVYGLTWKRYFWGIHGVNPIEVPPQLLQKIGLDNGKENDK